jgi:hypothetical protein
MKSFINRKRKINSFLHYLRNQKGNLISNLIAQVIIIIILKIKIKLKDNLIKIALDGESLLVTIMIIKIVCKECKKTNTEVQIVISTHHIIVAAERASLINHQYR